MLTEGSFDLRFSDFTFEGGSFMPVFGILHCAVLCLNTKECRSFFYNHNKRSCLVTSAGYLDSKGLTPRAGVNYYRLLSGHEMQCRTTADCSCKNCICSRGSCQCDVGYSYQPSNGSCVIGCSDYGDGFTSYPEYGVGGCNVKSVPLATGEACIEACRDEISFVCINAEHGENRGMCHMCDKAWFDLPDYTRKNGSVGWVLYYRQCAM